MPKNELGEIILCPECPGRETFVGSFEDATFKCVGPTDILSNGAVLDIAVCFEDADGGCSEQERYRYVSGERKQTKKQIAEAAAIRAEKLTDIANVMTEIASKRVVRCQGPPSRIRICPAIGGQALREVIGKQLRIANESEPQE